MAEQQRVLCWSCWHPLPSKETGEILQYFPGKSVRLAVCKIR